MKKALWISIAAVVIILLGALIIYESIKSTEMKENQLIQDPFAVTPKYSVVVSDVNYAGNARGYLAKPSEEGTYPGVIMIHEWWGLNENIKDVANKLASQGYVVFAVDLYSGQVFTDPEKAGELASAVRNNPQGAVNNMYEALTYLKNDERVSSVGSLGWCFGGQQSLRISLSQDLDATVIYYGNLVTDEESLSMLNGPVLGIFGSEDTSIPVDTVNEFQSTLNALEIQNEIHIYDGVSHAFANPSGNNYAPEETRDAWEKTLEFLEANLN